MTSYPILEFDVDESITMLRDSTARFAKTHIAPIAAKMDTENQFPRELWTKMGDMGFHGITISEEYGGSDLGYMAHVIVTEEISRASAALGLSYGTHSNLCMNQLSRWGSDAQKKHHLPKLVSGEYLGALAMSETGAGSDVTSMKLKATSVDGGFRLNGQKMWITNGPGADVLIVYAKTEAENGDNSTNAMNATNAMTAFIITKDMKGFSTAQKLDKLGMRGSDTSELIFDDCFVPQENILGELHQGVKVLMSGLDYERVVLSGISLGIMQACLDVVLPYIHERKQFDQPIGSFQIMQAKLADMYVALSSAKAYTYAVAAACDKQNASRKDAAGCILYASEQATRMAADAIQMLGGNGYMNEYPTGRLWRDAKLMEIGAGTSEIRRWLIGRELFEQSAG